MDSTYRNGFVIGEDNAVSAFNQLAERFYNRNFGRMSKTDFDTMMFAFYLKNCKALSPSDHEIAINLGITEAKVRSLRVNSQLLFPDDDYDWRALFRSCIEHAHYDDSIYKVVVPISNPNVRRDVEAYIDSKGWYNEYQLNAKLLIMRPDQFIDLCVALAEEDGCEITSAEAYRDKLVHQLAGSKASSELSTDSFIDKWKKESPGAAMKDLLKSAPKELFNAAISGLWNPCSWADTLKHLCR